MLVNSIIDIDEICISIQKSIVKAQEFSESHHKVEALTSKVSRQAQKYFYYLSSVAMLRMEARTANWPFWSYTAGRVYAKVIVEASLASKFLLFYTTEMDSHQEALSDAVIDCKIHLLNTLTSWMKWLEDLPQDMLYRLYGVLSEKDMQLWEIIFSQYELAKIKPLLEFLDTRYEEEKNFNILQLIHLSERILDRRAICSKKLKTV